jgi:hypothetical protein
LRRQNEGDAEEKERNKERDPEALIKSQFGG